MKKRIAMCAAVIMAAVGVVLPFDTQTAEAAAPTMVYYGSKNGDVWDLQQRLKHLGYTIKVDGVYGLQTERVVIAFQKANHLRIDGIAGPETWRALKKATANRTKPSGQKVSLSQSEKQWMARAVYSEARGEPYKGQVAVAAVILNRMKSDQFPNTAKGVILESGAFTAVQDGQIWLTPDSTAYRAVEDALAGWDPSGGALYYFNPATATSKWIWSRPQIQKIGKHIFAK